MKVAVFATCEAEPARQLLAAVRARHPGGELAVFVRDEHRDELAADLRGLDVRRDKPAGGKLAFVRALRRERFDELVVAWHGGERMQPLRLVAMFAGARRVVAVDERGRERTVAWSRPWTWAGHALRRGLSLPPLALLRGIAACYRATIGLLLGSLLLLPMAIQLWLARVLGRRT